MLGGRARPPLREAATSADAPSGRPASGPSFQALCGVDG